MKNKNKSSDKNKKIDRKEALIKVGKISALTATSMLFLLKPVDGEPKKKSPKPPRDLRGRDE